MFGIKYKHYQQLLVELEAINRQLSYTTSEVDRMRLRRQFDAAAEEVRKAEAELNTYSSKVQLSPNGSYPASSALESLKFGILDAFTLDSFKQMLYLKLGLELDRITTSSGLGSKVFDVLQYIQKQGSMKAFVVACAQAVPNNTSLMSSIVAYIKTDKAFNNSAASLWMEKQAYLSDALVTEVGGGAKFQLESQIKECQQNIIRLYSSN